MTKRTRKLLLSLSSRLIELGLEHRISWSDAATVLDAADADERAQDALGALLDGPAPVAADPPSDWRRPPPRPVTTPWSNPFGDTPRDLAVWLAFSEARGAKAINDRPLSDYYPHFWKADKTCATPLEAWHFDLDPDRNPGDHSGIPALPRKELGRQLALVADYRPRSRWLRERRRLLLEEHAERRST